MSSRVPQGSGDQPRRCAVYLHYDAVDILLYVGVTHNVHVRGEAHAITSLWSEFAARGEIEWCTSRSAAEDRELELIATQLPVFNIRDATEGWEQRVRCYLEANNRMDLLTARLAVTGDIWEAA